MIAYNKNWLDALMIKNKSKTLFKKGLINEGQLADVENKFHEKFYTPNPFLRIGLFAFAVVLTSCFAALIVWLFIDTIKDEVMGGFFAIFISIILWLALEFLIKRSKHYGSGVDDAFLYMATVLFISGVALIIFKNSNFNNGVLPLLLISFIFLAFLSIRYVDRFCAILAFICAAGIILKILLLTPEFLTTYFPFILAFFSAAVFVSSEKVLKNNHLRYWHSIANALSISGLFGIYLFLNLYFIHNLYATIFLFIKTGILFSFILKITTVIIPLIYLWIGIKNKNRQFLHLALVTIILSVATFFHYSNNIKIEILLLFAGMLTTAIAWGLIKYLKNDRKGFTYKEENDTAYLPNMEALLIVQSFGHSEGHDQEMKFGGGEFGGGGAGGEY